MSQKTFANHLADEEAALAQQQLANSSAIPHVPALKFAGSIPNLKRASTSEVHSGSAGLSQGGTDATGGAASASARDSLDNEPLLMVNVPSAPSEKEMQALLSGPPLSYNAARSHSPPAQKPQRQFCEVCGYWGTIKCIKCGARVCGLECKGVHDDGR